jgi:hypothetical protein
MAKITDSELKALKAKYDAAHEAYKAAAKARGETDVSGTDVWDHILKLEATALRDLNEARAEFITALAAFSSSRCSRIFGHTGNTPMPLCAIAYR